MMSTASASTLDWWYEPDTSATNNITYVIEGDFRDDNTTSLHLFMAPIVLPKKDKKPSKWLQKIIKNRGKKY